jgi:hypothetical protein
MKVIELTGSQSSLDELLELARKEILVLRKSNREGFVLAPIDEFDLETELLRNNQEFMAYLDELSAKKASIPLEQVEKELGL